jgi:hypothetical protein
VKAGLVNSKIKNLYLVRNNGSKERIVHALFEPDNVLNSSKLAPDTELTVFVKPVPDIEALKHMEIDVIRRIEGVDSIYNKIKADDLKSINNNLEPCLKKFDYISLLHNLFYMIEDETREIRLK